MPNRFQPIQPGTDENQKIAIVNRNFAELDNENVKKLYKDETGANRIFLDGATGTLKIAKEGFDVTTAENADLAFNSAQNVFKIVGKGTIEIPEVVSAKAGTSQYGFYVGTTTTVAHNLGYVPAVIAFLSSGGSSYVPLPWTRPDGVGSNSFCMLTQRVVVDETNVYGVADALVFNESDTHGGNTATYYLLQETAN